MEPVYDRLGRVVAWHNDVNIYHLNGSHAAVINGDNV